MLLTTTYIKRTLTYFLFILFITNIFTVPVIAAVELLPTNSDIKSGGITIKTENNTMTITQTSPAGEIHWESFDISKNAHVKFLQPGSNSVTLNKVVGGGSPSALLGKLSATGHVFVINPNGVIFGSDLDTTNLQGILVGGVNMELTLKEIEKGTIGLGESQWGFRVKDCPNTVSLKAGDGILADFSADYAELNLATALVIDLNGFAENQDIKLISKFQPSSTLVTIDRLPSRSYAKTKVQDFATQPVDNKGKPPATTKETPIGKLGIAKTGTTFLEQIRARLKPGDEHIATPTDTVSVAAAAPRTSTSIDAAAHPDADGHGGIKSHPVINKPSQHSEIRNVDAGARSSTISTSATAAAPPAKDPAAKPGTGPTILDLLSNVMRGRRATIKDDDDHDFLAPIQDKEPVVTGAADSISMAEKRATLQTKPTIHSSRQIPMQTPSKLAIAADNPLFKIYTQTGRALQSTPPAAPAATPAAIPTPPPPRQPAPVPAAQAAPAQPAPGGAPPLPPRRQPAAAAPALVPPPALAPAPIPVPPLPPQPRQPVAPVPAAQAAPAQSAPGGAPPLPPRRQAAPIAQPAQAALAQPAPVPALVPAAPALVPPPALAPAPIPVLPPPQPRQPAAPAIPIAQPAPGGAPPPLPPRRQAAPIAPPAPAQPAPVPALVPAAPALVPPPALAPAPIPVLPPQPRQPVAPVPAPAIPIAQPAPGGAPPPRQPAAIPVAPAAVLAQVQPAPVAVTAAIASTEEINKLLETLELAHKNTCIHEKLTMTKEETTNLANLCAAADQFIINKLTSTRINNSKPLLELFSTEYSNFTKVLTTANNIQYQSAETTTFLHLITNIPNAVLYQATAKLSKLSLAVQIVDETFQDPGITKITTELKLILTNLVQNKYNDKAIIASLYAKLQRTVNRLIILASLKGGTEANTMISNVTIAYNHFIFNAIAWTNTNPITK